MPALDLWGYVRTALTAVVAATGERLDVLLDLDPTHRVSALESALAPLLTPSAPGLWLDARRLEPHATVTDAGVRSACVLSLGGPLQQIHSHSGAAELHVVSGPDAGVVHLLTHGDLVVGAGADISIGDTPARLRLHVSRAGVVATDVGTAAPVLLAARPLAGPTSLGAADLLEVGANLLRVVGAARAPAAVAPGADLGIDVNRPPRLRLAATLSTVRLPSPPTSGEARRLALLPLLLPVALGVVMVALLVSPLFLLFTFMSPVLALHGWVSERRSNRASGALAQQTYAGELTACEQEIARLVAAETAARRTACPDPADVLLTATGPGPRLWERRRVDDDSLLLRVGTGAAEAGTVQVPGRQPVLRDVPITVDLRAVGVLGLAGPIDTTRALARALVGQLAVLHSPGDLAIVLLVDPEAPAPDDWAWLRWLPHTTIAGQALLGATGESLALRVSELLALVGARAEAARQVRAPRLEPDVVVVLDGARGLRSLPGLAAVLRDGPAVGVHLLCLDEQQRLLPAECNAVVRCDGATLTVTLGGGSPQQARGDLVSTRWAEQLARALSPLRDAAAERGDSQLPTSARLLDVLGLDPPTGDAVSARWAAGGRTTNAVVGLGVDGPVALDLSRDGPHALVAGTTGAGKSEFLQTLVASLAAANRPDAMTFVLVDYKGGAAFKDCARLPHTVGMVTDLDGHLVERALASLTAELKARERLLGRAGAKDVEDYWLAGAPAGPVARLVIVIDEFASLVEELPEFVRGLVGIAQRGRSLGVHLVLATQRPSGVVSPEIRANTNLRIALRVTDASESADVIDAPDAAGIALTSPGRAYARTGHASLTAFQSARVGGRASAAQPAGTQRRLQAYPLPWDQLGLPLPTPACDGGATTEDHTDLGALVDAVCDATASLGLAPVRTPWLDALPEVQPLGAPAALPCATGGSLPPVVYGLEDVPAEQSRQPAALDLDRGGHLLVAGAPRSGRSTLLRTLAASLARTVAPADVHLYALDCGNGALLPLAELPHCGAVVTRTEVERAGRLLDRLGAEVARRQELLAAKGYADLAEQRAGDQEPLPYLMLMVDRWDGFVSAFEDVDAGRMTDAFLRLLHEGPGVGLRIVVSGDRSLLLGKPASAVEDVLCLRLADRSDYALAGLSPRLMPTSITTGRAFRGGTGREVQVAVLGDDPSGPAQSAALSELVSAWVGREVAGPRPFRVDRLPTRLSSVDFQLPAGSSLTALVGVGGDELTAQGVDLETCGPGFVIAGPARSGRSTALLGMVRSVLNRGGRVCVLTPRASPLRELDGHPGVLAVLTSDDPDPALLLDLVNRTPGPLVVVVDDAELLHHTPVSDLLQQVLRDGRDQGHCLIAAGTTEELLTSFRGFTADARRSRSGLLLSPQSHLQGELLGVRLPRSATFDGPAGRGLLVRAGQVQLVQVPLP